MSLSKVIFKDSFYYGITSYLGIIAGVIFTPIYTRAFSKAEYGLMDLINTWNGFAQLIIPLGIPYAILRLYQEFNNNENEKKNNIGTLLSSIITLALIYIIVNEFFKSYLIENYYNCEVNNELFLISYGIVSFNILCEFFQSINRIEFRLKRFLFLNLSSFTILVSLGYYFAITLDMRILGFFYAALYSSGIKLLLASTLGHKDINFKFKLSILKGAIKYSFPMVLVLLLYNLTNIIDRFLIQNYLDIDIIGEFSVVNRINGVFKIFIDSFQYAWIPYAISIIKKPERNHEFQKSYSYYIIISGLLLFIIVLFTKEILLLFAPRYLNTEKYIYISLLTTQIKGLGIFYGLGMLITKKTYYELISVLSSVFINITISILLVDIMGLYGIIFGTLFGIIFYALIDRHITKKIIKIKFKIKNEMLVILIISLIIFGVIQFNNLEISLFKGIIFKCTFILIFIIGFLCFPKNRVKIKTAINQIKAKTHSHNLKE